jgi:hypothetical protein
MFGKLVTLGAVFALSISFQTIIAHAQYNSSEDWPASSFVKPLPSKVTNGKPVARDKSASAQALLEFMKSGAFLSRADVTNFSKSIESLVGNYFVYDEEKNVIQLLGQNFEDKHKNIAIKDVVVFSAVVDRKFSAGAKVPAFLDLNMQKDDLAELTIRNVASVVGKSKSIEVACNAPFGDFGKSNQKLFYITAATVSMIYKKVFEVREQGGSGLVSMLKLEGKNYYSNKIEQRVPVISVSSIPVPVVPSEKIYMCAKYNDALKSIQTASAGKKIVYRSLTKPQPDKKTQELNKLKKELSKALVVGDAKITQKMRGRVISVKK